MAVVADILMVDGQHWYKQSQDIAWGNSKQEVRRSLAVHLGTLSKHTKGIFQLLIHCLVVFVTNAD